MPRISPAKFVHIVYRTRRFDQMIDWYQAVFNARLQYKCPELAFLTYDDEHHRIAFANMDVLAPEAAGGPPTTKQGLIGVDHVAYTYPSMEALFENYEQLKKQGIEPYWCIHHGITVSMYYGDPDGNQMEFQIDAYSTSEEANAFMRGPGYAENSMGVEYDPEVWIAEVRSGKKKWSDYLERTVHQPISPFRSAADRIKEPADATA